MIYIDADPWIFAAVNNEEIGDQARESLQIIVENKIGITSSLTINEVMWVLIKLGHKEIIKEVVESIYESLKVVPMSENAPLTALDLIESINLKPRDALHVAIAKEHNIDEILSDDSDFDVVEGIERYDFEEIIDEYKDNSHEVNKENL